MPPSGGEPDAVVWSGEVAPKIPFSSDQYDVALDVKALCGLPWDAQQDGVRAFRLLLFQKGKVIHVPEMFGHYVVDGEWTTQTAIAVVHFKEATKRLPELLITFIDHGMADESQKGISVETVALPLLVKKDTYSSRMKVGPIEDVSGFTPISIGKVPWSLHLHKCLGNLPLTKALAIGRPAHMDKYIGTTLASRIGQLKQIAQGIIDDELVVAMRQDAGVASRRKAALVAKLNAMEATIRERSDEYEPRLTERIIKLADVDSSAPPANVDIAQMRTALAASPVPLLLRSQFASRRPVPDATTVVAEVNAEEAATGAGTGIEEDIVPVVGDDSAGIQPAVPPTARSPTEAHLVTSEDESESSSDNSEPAAKRARGPVQRLSDEAPQKRPKAAPNRSKGKSKAASKRSKGKQAKPVPAGVNRDGKPWKRGPYNTKSQGGETLTAAAKAAAKAAATTANVQPLCDQIDKLAAQVRTLTAENASLKAQLTSQANTANLERQIAVQQAQLSAADKIFTKYSQGVAMGMGRTSAPSGSMDAPQPMFTPFAGSVPRFTAAD